MQAIAYSNSSDDPDPNVQIDWTFNDGGDTVQTQGGSALQATGSTTVNITAVNDAATISTGFDDFVGDFGGSSSLVVNGKATIASDNRIAIDPSQTYDISVTAFSGDGAGGNYVPGEIHYFGFFSYDIDGNLITSQHTGKVAGAVDTTLAVDLVAGATQIVLNDATGWHNGTSSQNRSLAWYGYTNSLGETYDDYTYTRNTETDLWDQNAIVGNVITLRTAWAGPTILAGDAVRNMSPTGGTYQYPLGSGITVNETGGTFTTTLGGGLDSGATSQTLFRHGTAFISPLTLANFTSTSNQLNISDFTIQASQGTTVFIEDGGPIAISDADFAISDPDDTHTESVTITLTNGRIGDILNVNETAINALGISVTGIPAGNLTADGSITLTLTSDTANSVTFQDYQDAIATITFDSDDQDPDTTDRTITFVVNDGDVDSATETLVVKVHAVNDAPTVSTTPTDVTYTEGDAVVITAISAIPGGGLTDVDNTVLGVAVTGYTTTSGTFEYSINGGSTWNSFVGVSDTNARLLRLTDLVRFTPSTTNGGTLSINYRGWDQTTGTVGSLTDVTTNGGSTAYSSDTAVLNLNTTEVNDAPTFATNTGITINEGGSFTFTNAMLNEGDPDDSGTGLTYRVSPSPKYGRVYLSGTALDGGDTFTQDDIDNGRVTYTHSGTERGSDPIRLILTDGDENGAGDAIANFVVTINSVNDAPVAADDPGSAIDLDADADSIGVYSLGESSGTTATDSSGSNNGTYNNVTLGATGVPGGSGTAADFNGNDSYVNLGGLNVSGTGLTIAAWVNADSLDEGRIVSKASGIQESEHTWMLSTFDDGGQSHLRLRISAGGHVDTLIATTGDLQTGAWHHTAATYDAATGLMTIYLDGNIVGQATHSVGGAVDTNAQEVWIGAAPTSSPDAVRTFDGRIDEVAILQRELSTSEIAALADFTPADYSVNEDTTLTVSAANGVLANDSDIEGDSLTAVLVTGPSNASSFTLNADGSFNYTGNANFNGTDTFTYRANDGTNDSEIATVTITVNSANDAPVLDTSDDLRLPTITEDEVNNGGRTVAQILASGGGTPISDADSGSVEGIAITTRNNGRGLWEYSIDGGSNWSVVGTVSESEALLLRATDLVRFSPDGQNCNVTDRTFEFRAWDQTSGTAGTKVDTTTNGGSTAFSTGVETVAITTTDVNDAPVLDNSGTVTLTTQNEDAGAPAGSVGTVITSLVQVGGNVTDVDASAQTGVAITAADTTNGTWWYTTDSGATWNALGSVSESSARVLNASSTTRIYFQSNANFNGTVSDAITFRAWDRSVGSNGSLQDASTNGGTSAFSSATETVDMTIANVNDAPSGTDNTLAMLEDGEYTFAASDFGFNDIEGDAFDRIFVDSLPTLG
ncbi:MAG: tandem-95 repeat protein, partial [Rubripirellula sp.]